MEIILFAIAFVLMGFLLWAQRELRRALRIINSLDERISEDMDKIDELTLQVAEATAANAEAYQQGWAAAARAMEAALNATFRRTRPAGLSGPHYEIDPDDLAITHFDEPQS